MCQLRAGLKLFLKNVGGKKIKNIGSAMSVGLLVVRLLYCFYVFGHLSKWFTFFLFLVVCLLVSGRPLHLLPIGSGRGIAPPPSHGTRPRCKIGTGMNLSIHPPQTPWRQYGKHPAIILKRRIFSDCHFVFPDFWTNPRWLCQSFRATALSRSCFGRFHCWHSVPNETLVVTSWCSVFWCRFIHASYS